MSSNTHCSSVVTFRKRLKAIMKDRGVSQRELADRIGKKPPYVSALMTGIHVPRLDTLQEIADALHISAASLIE